MAADSGDFLCPNCQTAIQPAHVFCPGCGIDLVTLTLVLDQSAAETARARLTTEVPAVPVPRLGEFLVQRGLISEDQLTHALGRQKELAARGANRMLGEVLVALGLISQPILDRAIVAQLVSLQTALRDNNRLLAQRVAERTAELERAIERVKEINQLKLDFISTISHELRTPLMQIHGYVSMMYEGMLGEFTPRQRETLRAAAEAVGRLKQLIFDLMDYTSTARGEISIRADEFSLSELAGSVVQRSLKKATERRVALTYQASTGAIAAQGDMEKIGWVLLQLVDNAIRFTPPGGAVRLAVHVGQNRVRVAVHDTGVGIPASQRAGLFQPLRGGDGTRLGLAMASRIVEAHGSQIDVESVEGKGSTFWFELPLAAGSES